MIRELIHDPLFLARPSEPAAADDLPVAQDLLDTLAANRRTCVGMAANMIGVAKRIIAFDDGGRYAVMFNPEIIRKSGSYETEETCLSLPGGPRRIRRYRTVRVAYQGSDGKAHAKTYIGWTAQIIQHEVDHCNGVLI